MAAGARLRHQRIFKAPTKSRPVGLAARAGAAAAGVLAALALTQAAAALPGELVPTLMDAQIPAGYQPFGQALQYEDRLYFPLWRPGGGFPAIGEYNIPDIYNVADDTFVLHEATYVPPYSEPAWGTDGRFGYIFGTRIAVGCPSCDWAGDNRVWRFDPATEAWSSYGTLGDHWLAPGDPFLLDGSVWGPAGTTLPWDGARFVWPYAWSETFCDAEYWDEPIEYILGRCQLQRSILFYDPSTQQATDSGMVSPVVGRQVMNDPMSTQTGETTLLLRSGSASSPVERHIYRRAANDVLQLPVAASGRSLFLHFTTDDGHLAALGCCSGAAAGWLSDVSHLDPTSFGTTVFIPEMPERPPQGTDWDGGAHFAHAWTHDTPAGARGHQGYVFGMGEHGTDIVCFPACARGGIWEVLTGSNCHQRSHEFHARTWPERDFDAWAWDFGDAATAQWAPDQEHAFVTAGQYQVRATAESHFGEHIIATTSLQVGLQPCPPVLDELYPVTTVVGTALRTCAVARPGMGGALAFSSPLVPQGATLDAGTGCLEWTPTRAQTVACMRIVVTERPSGLTAAGCLALRAVPPPSDPAGDADGDGVPDWSDNCPAQRNPDQLDKDRDWVGDSCEAAETGPGIGPEKARPNSAGVVPDRDGDGVPDGDDLCPDVADPSQGDLDRDLMGDACDPDVDGDGVAETGASELLLDNCPLDANRDQADGDGDHGGDQCDRDLRTHDRTAGRAAVGPAGEVASTDGPGADDGGNARSAGQASIALLILTLALAVRHPRRGL